MIPITSDTDNGWWSDKNKKAFGLTALTCTILVLVFVFVSWTNTITKQNDTLDDGGVEVNFGNSDQGLGDIPPMVPGDPAPEAQEEPQLSPAATASSQEQEEESYKEVAENNDADVPAIKTSPTPKKVLKPAEKKIVIKKTEPRNTAPSTPTHAKPTTVMPSTANTVAKPAAAKAVYKGGNGKGGNGADSYNGVRSQGIAGGHGDQGKMGGNPNSDSYTGTGKGHGGSGSGSGKSGVSVVSGLNGRHFSGFPSFEDSFNENARVSVDIAVDEDGRVISASINPRGTTTTDSNIRSIALRRARQLKFSKGNVERQTGTVSFNFRLRG